MTLLRSLRSCDPSLCLPVLLGTIASVYKNRCARLICGAVFAITTRAAGFYLAQMDCQSPWMSIGANS